MASRIGEIGLVAVLAVLAVACGANHEPSSQTGSMPLGSASAKPNQAPIPTASAVCGGAGLSVDRGPYVIAGMQVSGYGFPDMGGQKVDVALRTVVVTGTVTAQEAAFFAGTRDVYTPFSVEVDRVIRGDAHVGRMLVAVEGGTVGCYALHVDEAPLVETGKRYVFFLAESVGAESARVFWDVWLVGPDNVVQTAQGPMPLAELIDRIQRLPAPAGSATP